MSDHYANTLIPSDVTRGLAAQLFDGLTTQLISIPVSMRVDSWVTDSLPDLVEQQKEIVKRQLQDALASLKPDVKKIIPQDVVKPSLTINAAHALFWSRQWGDPLLAMPYRSANLSAAGSRLLEIYDSTPSDPSHDTPLVDSWASELGLTSLFTSVPYKLDEL